MAQQMQGCQAPVQTVQTKMLGEPVLQLVFALAMCQRETSCLHAITVVQVVNANQIIGAGRRTVSRLCIYLTCLSTNRRISAGI